MSAPTGDGATLAAVGTDGLNRLATLLRCLVCRSELEPNGTALRCTGCHRDWPVRDGTARMLLDVSARSAEEDVKRQTANSFAYEWERFGVLRPEWRKNFLDYLRPHTEGFFAGRLVLDVGTGSGRHSRQASDLGAKVVAADLGDSIDVARRNLPPSVLTVQADAECLPFPPDTFDLVMSIGVLHHLPDPERALRSLVPYVKPGGWLHVYLYWQPEPRWHRSALRLVSTARKVTVRMPHRLLHTLCYPLSVALLVGIVGPYRVLRRIPAAHRVAGSLPLKTYADYPFSVLVNDQFDRFSAPLERRYTSEEVAELLQSAGLEEVRVLPNAGWVGSGRRAMP